MELHKNREVVFEETSHTYLNGDWKELIGVTTLMKKHGLSADYTGIAPEILAKAAARGSKIHKEIEDYCNGGEVLNPSAECEAFKTLGLKTLSNEYLVSDNEMVATMIDVVLENLDLCDIKTTSTFHHEAVSWQLSICAYLFELQNPELKAGDLYGIHVRGDKAKLVRVEKRPHDMIARLFECERSGIKFNADQTSEITPSESTTEIAELFNIEQFIANIELQAQQAKERREKLKCEIYKQMESAGQKKIETDAMTITKILPTTKAAVDSKALKEQYPEVYQKVVKSSNVKGSIRITLKQQTI